MSQAPQEFIQGRKQSAQQMLPIVEEEWYRAAMTSGKPDDLRRIAEYYARVTGLLDQDRGPALATVNVQFINGALGVTRAQPATPLEMVERLDSGPDDPGDLDAPLPTTAMADVESILRGLL